MIKHIATLPDGTVLKRNSASRTYAFCISGKRSLAYEVQQAHRDAGDLWLSNGQFYVDQVAGKEEVLYGQTPEQAKAEGLGELKGETTAIGYAARMLCDRLDEIEKLKREGFFDKYRDLACWVSRRDLIAGAIKKFSPYYVDLQAFPAIIKK